MAVKECYVDEAPQQNPWVQTPLRESYALSEAAGWYGHTPSHLYPLSSLSRHNMARSSRKGNSKS